MSTSAHRPLRYSAMTSSQKKEYEKKQIDEKYKEFEATVQRRLVRILHQREYIKQKENSIKGFEQVLREKHSEQTYTFIREELRSAQNKFSEMKNNLSELEKAFNLAHTELKMFLEKIFGPPRRGENCIAFGEIRTVLYYGKYTFVEVKKYK